MKKGFTLLELIFVIVVIGLLTAIALPQFNATRQDAKLVTVKQDIKTIIEGTQGYYTAKGSINSLADVAQVDPNIWDTTSNTEYIFNEKNKFCVKLILNNTAGSEELELDIAPATGTTANSGTVCKGLRAMGIVDTTYSLSGSKIVW